VTVDQLLRDHRPLAVGLLGALVLQGVGDLLQAVECGLQVGDDLVDAGDEQDVLGGERVGADPAAGGVGGDQLAGRGDGVDATKEVVCRLRLATGGLARLVVVDRPDLGREVLPAVVGVGEVVDVADLLPRRRVPVHHRGALRDLGDDRVECRLAVGDPDHVEAVLFEVLDGLGDRLLVGDRV